MIIIAIAITKKITRLIDIVLYFRCLNHRHDHYYNEYCYDLL